MLAFFLRYENKNYLPTFFSRSKQIIEIFSRQMEKSSQKNDEAQMFLIYKVSRGSPVNRYS